MAKRILFTWILTTVICVVYDLIFHDMEFRKILINGMIFSAVLAFVFMVIDAYERDEKGQATKHESTQ